MVMSLDHALRIVGAEAAVFGGADQYLLAELNAAGVVPQGKRLALPAGLQGDFPVRPVEVLHALSYATSPLYEDDLHDMYVRWGLLRYLGFFEHGEREDEMIPSLGVSEAGCRVAGTQRRVTSEELGVGFGVILARRWFRRALGAGVPIGFIDVDAYMSGSGLGGSIRSDYLLIAPDTAKAGCYRVRLLECKGTQEEPVAWGQMRKAVRQLGSAIICPLPDGIAVSSVTYGEQVRCFAVEARGEGEASYQPDWDVKDVRWETGEIGRSAESGRFLAAALRETWGRLADFGGNVEARNAWSSPDHEDDTVTQVGVRERNEFQTPYGRAIGVTETVTIGNVGLSVTRAIDASVDSALDSEDPVIVTAAQSRFAGRIERSAGDQSGIVPQSFSAAPDGSIFFLSL
jgi:hypothetical protein